MKKAKSIILGIMIMVLAYQMVVAFLCVEVFDNFPELRIHGRLNFAIEAVMVFFAYYGVAGAIDKVTRWIEDADKEVPTRN